MSCLELEDVEILKIADPMMDDVIRGASRRDYTLHSCHFSVSLKSQLTPERFLEQCDERESRWGLPAQRELVCVFRKHKSFSVVWNLAFSNTDDQVMAVLTVALKGGRYFVDYCLFH